MHWRLQIPSVGLADSAELPGSARAVSGTVVAATAIACSAIEGVGWLVCRGLCHGLKGT